MVWTANRLSEEGPTVVRNEVHLLRFLEQLREENSKLREELSAFDLDFFEEIEDLKYKYAEAMRRLQQYE